MLAHAHSGAHLLLTSLVLGVIILATIVGNVFVIAAIVLERNLRNVANYLIASLAVADLLVAALVMPLAAVNEVSSRWFLGREACDAFVSFDVLCCTSSILHLVAISLDRYWAVTRVDYIHNRSARRILVMVAASWGISAVISIPPLFVASDDDVDSLNVTGNSTAPQASRQSCVVSGVQASAGYQSSKCSDLSNFSGSSVAEWLACWTRVQIAVATLSGNSLRQTVYTHCASVHQPAKLVAALLGVAGVTAGLTESNGSLPPS